jgi:ketol-acid reductoisomerase
MTTMPEPLKMVYEKDAPLDGLKGKTVAILGFGSQGHAHAQNMRDSGLKVIVANRRDSANGRLAVEKGFDPVSVEDAVRPPTWPSSPCRTRCSRRCTTSRSPRTSRPARRSASPTGSTSTSRRSSRRPDVDVILVAPKGPGHLVRSEFEKGGGVPCLLAIHQDPSGNARGTGLAWANGVGGARSGIIETTFKDECETDLFGEQAVLCGGSRR